MGQSWQAWTIWCSQVWQGLALDFLGRRAYLGFRALLNLNPWTRQSSHKNIYLLHLVAWEGREWNVGSFGLALYRVSPVCFPSPFSLIPWKGHNPNSFHWRISQSEGKWEARDENPLKRLWNTDFHSFKLICKYLFECCVFVQEFEQKMYRVWCPIGIQPYINVFLTSGILCLFKIRKLLTISFVYLCLK